MKEIFKRLYQLNHKYKLRGELTREESEELTSLLETVKNQIDLIEDDYAQYCLRERYINAKPWQTIADEMGYYSDDSVRKCCERAIKKYM